MYVNGAFACYRLITLCASYSKSLLNKILYSTHIIHNWIRVHVITFLCVSNSADAHAHSAHESTLCYRSHCSFQYYRIGILSPNNVSLGSSFASTLGKSLWNVNANTTEYHVIHIYLKYYICAHISAWYCAVLCLYWPQTVYIFNTRLFVCEQTHTHTNT